MGQEPGSGHAAVLASQSSVMGLYVNTIIPHLLSQFKNEFYHGIKRTRKYIKKYCFPFTSEKVSNRLLRRLAFVPDYIVNEQELRPQHGH